MSTAKAQKPIETTHDDVFAMRAFLFEKSFCLHRTIKKRFLPHDQQKQPELENNFR